MSVPKCCVYVLRSCADPARYYTGLTSDWRARLEAHKCGEMRPHGNWASVANRRHRPLRRRATCGRLRAISEIRIRLRLRQAPSALTIMIGPTVGRPRPAARQTASTGLTANQAAQRKVRMCAQTRRRARHAPRQNRLDAVAQVFRDQRLEVAALGANAVLGDIDDGLTPMSA